MLGRTLGIQDMSPNQEGGFGILDLFGVYAIERSDGRWLGKEREIRNRLDPGVIGCPGA